MLSGSGVAAAALAPWALIGVFAALGAWRLARVPR
jgi:hypothetical protein